IASEVVIPAKVAEKDTVTAKAVATKKEKPTPVVHLLHLPTGDTTNFIKAENFQITNNERYFLFTKKGADKDTLNEAGLYLYEIATKKLKKISSGKGNYKNFTFDDDNNQLTFLADKSPEKAQLKNFKLYYYTAKQDTATI